MNMLSEGGIRNPEKGHWALVTGTSSGLGCDFARGMASRGVNLVLTARRSALLKELKAELVKDFGVAVEVIPADLASTTDVSALLDSIRDKGIVVDYLINNAGFGLNGDFANHSWEMIERMLKVNILALTNLTKYFADEMKKRNYGHILLLGSVGSYTACPTYATYGATKAYVLSLGEAIHHELKDSNVKVSVLCPGPTATEFMTTAGQELNSFQKKFMMDSRSVALFGIKAMFDGKSSVIPGFANRAMIFLSRIMSRQCSANLAHRAMS